MKSNLLIIKKLLQKMSDVSDKRKTLTHALGYSSLSYFSDEFIAKHLPDAVISFKIASINKLKCLMVEEQDAVYVAFRGTDLTKFLTVKRALNFFPVRLLQTRIHHGFALYFRDYESFVETMLASMNSSKKIIFTGHSMGAAVASLFQLKYSNRSICLNFATPNFIFDHKPIINNANNHSYLIKQDIVTKIPPSVSFFIWHRSCADYKLNASKTFLNPLKYHKLDNYISMILEM